MAAAIDDFVGAVERIAPPCLAYEWDNSGLNLRCSGEVSRVLIALDVTNDTANEAEKLGCDMILSHHPLIFEPVKSLSVDRVSDSVLMRLIRAGISLYAAHTSYDRASGGVGDILASKLGLTQIEAEADSGEYLMRTGYLKSTLKKHEFLDHVKRSLDSGMLRVSAADIETVRKVAVVGGSGGGFIEAAKRSGADALVTGEAKHHHFIEAKMQNVLLVEAGHYETERCFTPEVFMSLQSTLNELQLNVELFEANSAQSPYECI